MQKQQSTSLVRKNDQHCLHGIKAARVGVAGFWAAQRLQRRDKIRFVSGRGFSRAAKSYKTQPRLQALRRRPGEDTRRITKPQPRQGRHIIASSATIPLAS